MIYEMSRNIGAWVVAFMIILVAHEAGHYVAFRKYGIKPKIKVRWWAVSIGEMQLYKLKPGQFVWVLMTGIILGFIVMYMTFIMNMIPMTQMSNMTMLYMFMSSNDLINIMKLTMVKKDKWKLNLYQIEKDYLEQVKMNMEAE